MDGLLTSHEGTYVHAPGVTCCQGNTTVDITTVPRRSYVISWF